jgi:hypothetical protein
MADVSRTTMLHGTGMQRICRWSMARTPTAVVGTGQAVTNQHQQKDLL